MALNYLRVDANVVQIRTIDMEKELKCRNCSCYLGVITIGKIKKGSVIRCESCNSEHEVSVTAAGFKNIGQNKDDGLDSALRDWKKEFFE